ncbi:ImmA/IrrE family metallo-endopeptidase [Clostridium fallax]|uniref:IrrE N-terminal-like domain-containing protein n=1 Tax=Clostridium fallax TaxID=1533 RepID=A0A1M4UX81_9CLOT|nr:ImmA/IrrE family metallo-endopeptidase [Clostridium fallax]SHE61351.1 hypothetical protein SAMN05443638_10645 [Clostridium fallax]SQB06765.1 phage protein [Clostridium fallax]
MANYDVLIKEAEKDGIEVIEINFGVNSPCGKCIGNKIFINSKNNIKEKTCVLAEELGHFHKTVGNICNQNNIIHKKQELIARRWSYDKNIGLVGIINAFEYGCKGRYELAEYLNITEEFLQEALDYYKSKYGSWYELDNYIIRFEPTLGVLKKFEDF